MIVRWMTQSPTELRAVWQGKALSIEWNQTEHKWTAHVDEQLVRQRWYTAQAAKESIDAIVFKQLCELTPTVHAVQSAQSEERIVRHAAN